MHFYRQYSCLQCQSCQQVEFSFRHKYCLQYRQQNFVLPDLTGLSLYGISGNSFTCLLNFLLQTTESWFPVLWAESSATWRPTFIKCSGPWTLFCWVFFKHVDEHPRGINTVTPCTHQNCDDASPTACEDWKNSWDDMHWSRPTSTFWWTSSVASGSGVLCEWDVLLGRWHHTHPCIYESLWLSPDMAQQQQIRPFVFDHMLWQHLDHGN